MNIYQFTGKLYSQSDQWLGWPDHDQQHFYHHAPTVKPRATIAVVELLMMAWRTPETF
jgi:hypothetical protein